MSQRGCRVPCAVEVGSSSREMAMQANLPEEPIFSKKPLVKSLTVGQYLRASG
jgi:hypothetical protein